MKLDKGQAYSATLIRDPMDKRLYQKCRKVMDPRSMETFSIIDRMKFICKQAGGIGLAANQIGINRRIIVCYNEQTGELLEFINPRITDGTVQSNSNVSWDTEGCLSHPGIHGEVARYTTIQFAAQRMRDTKEQMFTASGLISRVLQHEIDHINGRMYTDLGPEVRNITFDGPGQLKLMEATKKSEEEGPQDFVID